MAPPTRSAGLLSVLALLLLPSLAVAAGGPQTPALEIIQAPLVDPGEVAMALCPGEDPCPDGWLAAYDQAQDCYVCFEPNEFVGDAAVVCEGEDCSAPNDTLEWDEVLGCWACVADGTGLCVGATCEDGDFVTYNADDDCYECAAEAPADPECVAEPPALPGDLVSVRALWFCGTQALIARSSSGLMAILSGTTTSSGPALFLDPATNRAMLSGRLLTTATDHVIMRATHSGAAWHLVNGYLGSQSRTVAELLDDGAFLRGYGATHANAGSAVGGSLSDFVWWTRNSAGFGVASEEAAETAGIFWTEPAPGTDRVTWKARAMGASWNGTWPEDDGDAGEYAMTDGSGNLSFEPLTLDTTTGGDTITFTDEALLTVAGHGGATGAPPTFAAGVVSGGAVSFGFLQTASFPEAAGAAMSFLWNTPFDYDSTKGMTIFVYGYMATDVAAGGVDWTIQSKQVAEDADMASAFSAADGTANGDCDWSVDANVGDDGDDPIDQQVATCLLSASALPATAGLPTYIRLARDAADATNDTNTSAALVTHIVLRYSRTQ